MPARFGDILQAFEFADVSGGMEGCRAFVCRQTGKIYYQFEDDDLQELKDDELPDDIENETKYLPVPNSHGLDLGKPLVLAFVREHLPSDLDQVRFIFSKRGAYENFKTLLSRRRAIDDWHDYRNQATERALRDWCKLHSIEITD
ncbi:hypothetical protein PMI42_03685 [Bradyrhizobium sp. YR681]|uniref:UPF0158 family protein n=1 Tax=Bradyrhizobium sp. YR681 TaxID=1144344 RepID=UPI0002711459|nr:UPF0158 family protein [Bradyrhizobium sp. YR681]EJN13068.1 hypothetical protein PMI42_03685 [Bradyrhizobium sp. YR681]